MGYEHIKMAAARRTQAATAARSLKQYKQCLYACRTSGCTERASAKRPTAERVRTQEAYKAWALEAHVAAAPPRVRLSVPFAGVSTYAEAYPAHAHERPPPPAQAPVQRARPRRCFFWALQPARCSNTYRIFSTYMLCVMLCQHLQGRCAAQHALGVPGRQPCKVRSAHKLRRRLPSACHRAAPGPAAAAAAPRRRALRRREHV